MFIYTIQTIDNIATKHTTQNKPPNPENIQNITPLTRKHSITQTTATPNTTTKPKSAENDIIVEADLLSFTISNMDHDYLSNNSNISQVSQYVPDAEEYDSDSSICYDDDLLDQHTELEDMLLDGLIADECTADYI